MPDYFRINYFFCVFFFSSRRRHTRYWRDWSSDVCSSDLSSMPGDVRGCLPHPARPHVSLTPVPVEDVVDADGVDSSASVDELAVTDVNAEIGRASCRERV